MVHRRPDQKRFRIGDVARASLERAKDALAALQEQAKTDLEAQKALERLRAGSGENSLEGIDEAIDERGVARIAGLQLAGRERQLEFALKAIEPAQASEVLGGLLAKQGGPRDGAGPWIELIGSAGGALKVGLGEGSDV